MCIWIHPVSLVQIYFSAWMIVKVKQNQQIQHLTYETLLSVAIVK